METTALLQPPTVDVGDLSELHADWSRHLRATNRAACTVRRYEKDARVRLPGSHRPPSWALADPAAALALLIDEGEIITNLPTG